MIKRFPTALVGSFESKKNEPLGSSLMRRVGLEPTRSKAITGSLVLRVCQFRHPRYSVAT